MKIRSVGAGVFHADGRIDRQKERQTDIQNKAILRTPLKTESADTNSFMFLNTEWL